MTVGIVTGVDPVSISVDGVPIAEHIYCNQVTSSNKDEELAAILEQEEYVSPALKGFLKELYEGIPGTAWGLCTGTAGSEISF